MVNENKRIFAAHILYKKNKTTHTFFGCNNLATGVMCNSGDLEKAWNEMLSQLERVMEDNHHIYCDIMPSISLEEFEKQPPEILEIYCKER